MEKVDMKTLIHVGTELVAIGGLTFWMNKRISSIQSQVSTRDEKIGELETIIQQQSRMLAEHEHVLRMLMKGTMPPPRVEEETHNIPPRQAPPQRVQRSEPPPVEEEVISDGDMDDLIKKELEELEENRSAIQIDVVEGESILKPDPVQNKVKKTEE